MGDFPHPQQHRRHVCERCQIPRRADRPLARYHRQQVGIEQFDQRLDDNQTNAGIPLRHTGDFQRKNQPHHIRLQRRADTHRMGQHQIFLQQLKLVMGNMGLRETAKTGVDAIGGRTAGGDFCHRIGAGVNGGQGGGVKREVDAVLY